MTNGSEERSGRETRLLVLVVVVSLAVLLVLARFRYPAAGLTTVASTPGMLGGLAARATFDDAASTLSGLLGRVSPLFVVVQLDVTPEPALARGAEGRSSARPPEPVRAAPIAAAPTFAAALRVRQDLAIVHVPPGWQPTLVPATAQAVSVAAYDPIRELALIHVAADPFIPDVLGNAADAFSGSSYAGVVDAAPGGATIQALFIGRAERTPDSIWPRPVLGIGRAAAPVGGFVFSLDGRLIGYVASAFGGAAIVPADVLGAVTAELVAKGAGR